MLVHRGLKVALCEGMSRWKAGSAFRESALPGRFSSDVEMASALKLQSPDAASEHYERSPRRPEVLVINHMSHRVGHSERQSW